MPNQWENLKNNPALVVGGFVIGAFCAGFGAYAVLQKGVDAGVIAALNKPGVIDKLPIGPAGPEGVGAPIGAVIAYAGPLVESKLPPEVAAHFEICDGELVTTPGPMAGKRKPDLRGRFVRGLTVDELPRMNSQSNEKDITFKPEGANRHDLSHSHGAGSLGVMWAKSGGWDHYFVKTTTNDVMNTMRGGSPETRASNYQTNERLRIDGRSESEGLVFDNRPEHVALIYIIRVK
ncbi:MAG TPA: hypothetical protein VK157_08190 [Phycisphaerales bacterium]|nr:hypothetical protein [Phycisphaerales bacterium]